MNFLNMIIAALMISLGFVACGKKEKKNAAADCVTEDSASLRLTAADDDEEAEEEEEEDEETDEAVEDPCVTSLSAEEKNYGEITEKKNTLGFEPTSAYAIVAANGDVKSFSLLVTDRPVDKDAMEKDVKKYTCEPCDDEDDPRCNADEAPEYADLMIIMSQDAISSKGLPKSASYELSGDPLEDLKTGVMIMYTGESPENTAKLAPEGTVKFKKKPAKEGADFTASIKLKLKVKGKSKEYTADVDTTVIKMGKQPKKIPECEVGEEYLQPVYE
jgi:hypothetical protein